MVDDAFLLVDVVVTMKPFDVVPADTTILAGTETSDRFVLLRATTTPPPGAGAVSVTVPMADVPPLTDVALSVSLARAGAGAGAGLTVNVVVLVTPAYVADSVVRVCVTTAEVVMPNVAELAAWGTV